MTIEINLFSLTKLLNINIDTKKEVCEINGEEKKLNVPNFEERFTDIILFWPSELKAPQNLLDAPRCKVVAKDDDAESEFNFDGKMPDNFKEFLNLLKEVENC